LLLRKISLSGYWIHRSPQPYISIVYDDPAKPPSSEDKENTQQRSQVPMAAAAGALCRLGILKNQIGTPEDCPEFLLKLFESCLMCP
jgi:hypothetical protein